MTKLRTTPFRIPSWVRGVIEGMDASVAPVGSLASALNFIPTPAERLAVRGGSAVVQTLHDDAATPAALLSADTFVDEGSGTPLPAHTPSGSPNAFTWTESGLATWGASLYTDGADPDHPDSALLPVSPGWGLTVAAAVDTDSLTPTGANYAVHADIGFPFAMLRNVSLGVVGRTDADGVSGYRAELRVSGAVDTFVMDILDDEVSFVSMVVTDIESQTIGASGFAYTNSLGEYVTDHDTYLPGGTGNSAAAMHLIGYVAGGLSMVEGDFSFDAGLTLSPLPFVVLSVSLQSDTTVPFAAPPYPDRAEVRLSPDGTVRLLEWTTDFDVLEAAVATTVLAAPQSGTLGIEYDGVTGHFNAYVNGRLVLTLHSALAQRVPTFGPGPNNVYSIKPIRIFGFEANGRNLDVVSGYDYARWHALRMGTGGSHQNDADTAHPTCVLSKVNGAGVATVLGTQGMTLTTNVTHALSLECFGTTIAVLVDAVEILSVTDATYAGPGFAGVYGTQDQDGTGGEGTAWLDNFEVWSEAVVDAELATTLRLDPFTAIGMVAVGWSSGQSKHYLYRLTPNAAFFTGTESTSRTDLTAAPSMGWNVGPRRPFSVELFSKLFLIDCTPVFTDRQPMVTIDAAGTLLEPLYALSGAIAATAVLTSDGTKPTANDTVTIGSVTYTFKATVGVTANQVLIGVSALTALSNLVDAVNLAPGGSAINYGSATVVNPDASGAITTALKATFTALAGGVGGNSLPSTEASSHLSFANVTFTGGAGSTPSPLKPLCAEEYNNVLFVAGYGDEGGQDVPNLIRHSFLGQDPGNPATGFDPLAYNHIGADGVPILALKKGRGILLVFKVNEIWRITGFGNAFPGWQYQTELVNNTFGYGVSNPWAVTFAEDYWYGWGLNGPFRTDGYTVESLRGPREVSWRLLNQFDRYWVEYHPDRRVVCFGVHPAQTSGSRSATVPWDVWNWDLARSVWTSDWEFGQSLHSPDFGAGYDLNHVKAINTTTVTGPTAPPVIAAVSAVSLHTFTANWTNGDTSAQTEVWVSQAAGPFTLFGTAAAGAISLPITGWVAGNAYTVKVRHTKAGVVTAFSATTGWSAAGSPPTAIAGATSVVYVNVVVPEFGDPTPANVSFVVIDALDTLDLYQDGVVVTTWTAVAAGTVVSNFELTPDHPGSSLFHFRATRVNYTFIDTPDVSVLMSV